VTAFLFAPEKYSYLLTYLLIVAVVKTSQPIKQELQEEKDTRMNGSPRFLHHTAKMNLTLTLTLTAREEKFTRCDGKTEDRRADSF